MAATPVIPRGIEKRSVSSTNATRMWGTLPVLDYSVMSDRKVEQHRELSRRPYQTCQHGNRLYFRAAKRLLPARIAPAKTSAWSQPVSGGNRPTRHPHPPSSAA